ncbi:MAG: S8 family serine peptidase, partial [Gemmataceae bacterium]
WGGGGFSSSLQAAIKRSEANDVLFVESAGNDNSINDARPAYPASYNVPNVISVAATNNNDVLAGFSNYGANSVDIAAPGVGIESTIPNNTYSSYSGTSMAAPHVSGAAAVLWAENPDLSYSEVRDLLLNNTDPLPPQTKQVATGRLNLFKALEASQPQEPNPTPPGLTLTETNDSTAVSEDGVSDTYTFVLESQPSSNVTIQIQTDGQVTTSVSEVTFTPSNWSSVQQVRVFAVDDSAFEGNHTSVISHTVSSEDSNYNGFEVANVDVAISDNDTPPPPPPPSNDTLYFTLENSTTAASLSVGTEDIVAFDGTNYSIVFDGSDVGLGDLAIDAFDVISENQVLLSFSTPAFNGAIDDSDIILFEGTLGENTSGTFYYYFDGSDVGLTSRSEDVDGLTLLDDGRLLISTVGNGSVVGGSFADEDILIFTPTSLGMNTGGSFLMLLDSSSVGLANGSEDIDGFTFKDGDLYFTTVGNFAVSGLSGADDDVGIMDFSSGSFNSQLYLNFTSNDLKGLDFAGTATASSLGLLGGRSIEDVPFGRAELNIIDQATSTSTGLTSGDLASVLSATSSDDFMLQSRTQDVNTNNVPVAQSATIVTHQAQSEQVGGLGSLIVLDTTDDQESEQERESDEIQLDHSTKQVSVPIKTAEVTPVDPGIVEVEEIEVVVTGSETSADLDVQAETEAPKVEEETVSCTSQVTITGMVSVGVILSAGWNWKPSRSPERRKRSLPESV